jgi:inorganic pyrophosphatase
MRNLFHIDKGDRFPEVLRAVIEVPYGSRSKYEYDINTGILKLNRILRTSARYPGNYGFVPQTLGNFRNPVDVYVLLNEPLFPGCVLEVKPLGLLEMADEMGTDNKVIAVPAPDPRSEEIDDISQVRSFALEEIKHFFETYKSGTHVKGWQGKEEAHAFLKKAHTRYLDRFSTEPGEV